MDEKGFSHIGNGNLHFYGVDLVKIAHALGTPLYMFSQSRIESNLTNIQEAFSNEFGPRVEIAYPLKVNSILGIIDIFRRRGTRFEVSSLGELLRCKTIGVEPHKVVYSNITKPLVAIRYALDYGVTIVLDSYADYLQVTQVSESSRRRLPVFVRINPLMEGRGSQFTSGTNQGKFGVPIKETGSDHVGSVSASELLCQIADEGHMAPVGLQLHLASQILDPHVYSVAAASVADLVYEVETRSPKVRLEYLDFGGGFPVQYHPEQAVPPIQEYARAIAHPLQAAGLGDRTMVIEPGRSTVGDAGILLLTVETVKEHPVHGAFAVVDASIYNVLLDSLFFDWYFEVDLANRGTGPRKPIKISGCTSDSPDVLGRWKSRSCPHCGGVVTEAVLRELPEIIPGDVVVVKDAGAYTTTFNNNFGGFCKPAVALVQSDGRVRLIRKREQVEDTLSHEIIP